MKDLAFCCLIFVEGDFNDEDINACGIEPHVVKMGLMTLMRSSQNNAIHGYVMLVATSMRCNLTHIL